MQNLEQVKSELGRETEIFLSIKNQTQIELAHDLDLELLNWIELYSENFDCFLQNHPGILVRLEDEQARTEALAEIKKNLYS